MKAFFHINEYDPSHFTFLNAAILAFDEVILWGPSAYVLDQATDSGSTKIGCKEILELSAIGAVKVAGRASWFDKRHRESIASREKAWPGFAWRDGFDGEFPASAKIVVAEEGGRDWAEKQFSEHSPYFVNAQHIHSKRELIYGLRDKLSQDGDYDTEIKSILRDAYNHSAARKSVGAKLSLEPDLNARPLSSIFWDAPENDTINEPTTLSESNIRDVLDFINHLQPGTTIEVLKTQIQAVRPYRSSLLRFLFSDEPFEKEFLSEAALERKRMGFGDILGDSFGERAFSVAVGGSAVVSAAIAGKESLKQGGFDRRTLLAFGTACVAVADAGGRITSKAGEAAALTKSSNKGRETFFSILHEMPNLRSEEDLLSKFNYWANSRIR